MLKQKQETKQNDKKKYLIGVLIGFALVFAVALLFTKGNQSIINIASADSKGLISYDLTPSDSNSNVITNKINDKEINITTYAIVAGEDTNIDSDVIGYSIEIDNGYKFGFNYTIPEDGISLTPVSSNLQYIVFNITSEYPLEFYRNWFRAYINESSLGNMNHLKNYMVYNFDDILESFKYQVWDEFCYEGMKEGCWNEETISYELILTEKSALIKFDFSSIDIAERQVITLDPTVILAGDTTYSATKADVVQESGFVHLNLSDNEIILYYPFDANTTTIYDYSNNNNDGVMAGSINQTQAIYGYGINDTGGAGTRITSGNLNDAIEGINNFSVSFWFKAQITDSNTVLSFTSAEDIFYCYHTTGMNCRIYNASGTNKFVSFGDTDDYLWHHFVFSKNDTHAFGYRDAVLGADQESIPGPTPTSTSNLYVLPANYHALMDELIIYNRTIDQDEATAIYTNQSAKFKSSGTMSTTIDVSGDGNENRLNVSVSSLDKYQALMGTNITFKAGDGEFVNFSSTGNITNYAFTDSPDTLAVYFYLYSDSNSFYSPLIGGNITFQSWYDDGGIDTCTCVTDDNWVIDCTDNCAITANCAMQAGTNITLGGSGTITMTANITGFYQGIVHNNCKVNCLTGEGCLMPG